MKKLKNLELNPVSEKDKERLSRWLFEWNILRSSISDDVDDIQHKGTTDTLPEGSVALPDGNVEVGQIRLLAPGADAEMVFIVVVSINEGGDIGIVPFSQLAEPATPEELLSSRDKDIVRVYCLWNIREIPVDIVCKSWIVDTLDKKEEAHLLRALDAHLHGRPLPDDLQKDTGPSLVHPDDPRREYINYERLRIDRAVLSEQNTIFLYDTDKRREFLKAAESGDDYKA